MTSLDYTAEFFHQKHRSPDRYWCWWSILKIIVSAGDPHTLIMLVFSTNHLRTIVFMLWHCLFVSRNNRNVLHWLIAVWWPFWRLWRSTGAQRKDDLAAGRLFGFGFHLGLSRPPPDFNGRQLSPDGNVVGRWCLCTASIPTARAGG